MTGEPDISDIPTGENGAAPVKRAAIVIYATLGILALAIPQGLSSWTRDLPPGPTQERLTAAAEAVERVSDTLGLSFPYRKARDLFFTLTGKDKD